MKKHCILIILKRNHKRLQHKQLPVSNFHMTSVQRILFRYLNFSQQYFFKTDKICSTTKAALTLRIVLEQQLQLLQNTQLDWPQYATNFVDIISKFIPNPNHYELDVFILWFFVLEIVGNPNWVFEKTAEEKVIYTIKLFQILTAGCFPKESTKICWDCCFVKYWKPWKSGRENRKVEIEDISGKE